MESSSMLPRRVMRKVTSPAKSSSVPFWRRISKLLLGAAPAVPLLSKRMGVSPLLGMATRASSIIFCSRFDMKEPKPLAALTRLPRER